MNGRHGIGTLAIVAPVALAMLFPLLWIVSVSLKGDAEQFVTPPTLVPIEPV